MRLFRKTLVASPAAKRLQNHTASQRTPHGPPFRNNFNSKSAFLSSDKWGEGEGEGEGEKREERNHDVAISMAFDHTSFLHPNHIRKLVLIIIL